MDEFELFSEKDKSNIAYGACVGGMALTGAAVGRFLGLQGVMVGAVAGAAYGLMTCSKLEAPIRRKLFSSKSRFSDKELASGLAALRLREPRLSKAEAMKRFAQVRHEVSSNPRKYQVV